MARKLTATMAALLLVTGLAACDEEESASEKVGEAVEDTGEAIEESAEEAEEEMNN